MTWAAVETQLGGVVKQPRDLRAVQLRKRLAHHAAGPVGDADAALATKDNPHQRVMALVSRKRAHGGKRQRRSSEKCAPRREGEAACHTRRW